MAGPCGFTRRAPACCAVFVVVVGCSGSSDGSIGGPPEPTLSEGLRVTVQNRGSGAPGSGILIRLGETEARVFLDEPAEVELGPGTYAASLLEHDEWCVIDPLPQSVTVEATRVSSLVIGTDCVGGLAYDMRINQFQHELRHLTTTGEDVRLKNWGLINLEAWSPDGRQLAFRNGGTALHVYDFEAGEAIVLPHFGGWQRHVTWSPDSEWLAFNATAPREDLKTAIFVIRRDGTGPRPFFLGGWTTGGPDLYPHWSPDGSSLVFSSYRGGDPPDVFIAPVGTEPVEVETARLFAAGHANSVRWSHDGRWIAWESFITGLTVSVAAVDGSRSYVRTDGHYYPIWSPVENLLLYEASDASGPYLAVFDAEAGTLSAKIRVDVNQQGYAWSGDGEWIAFTRRDVRPFELGIVRKDGTGMRTVLTKPDFVRGVRWDPTVVH